MGQIPALLGPSYPCGTGSGPGLRRDLLTRAVARGLLRVSGALAVMKCSQPQRGWREPCPRAVALPRSPLPPDTPHRGLGRGRAGARAGCPAAAEDAALLPELWQAGREGQVVPDGTWLQLGQAARPPGASALHGAGSGSQIKIELKHEPNFPGRCRCRCHPAAPLPLHPSGWLRPARVPPTGPGEGGGGSSRLWVRMLVDQMATEAQSHAATWRGAPRTGLKAAPGRRRAGGHSSQPAPPDPRPRGGNLLTHVTQMVPGAHPEEGQLPGEPGGAGRRAALAVLHSKDDFLKLV